VNTEEMLEIARINDMALRAARLLMECSDGLLARGDPEEAATLNQTIEDIAVQFKSWIDNFGKDLVEQVDE